MAVHEADGYQHKKHHGLADKAKDQTRIVTGPAKDPEVAATEVAQALSAKSAKGESVDKFRPKRKK